MKKLLFFSALLLNTSLIYAEEVDLSELSCLNNPLCKSCSQYAKFLFPLEEFNREPDTLEIEADQSEIIGEDTYYIIGNVKAKSDSHILFADELTVNRSDQSSLAKGNIKFQDSNWLLTSNELSVAKNEDGVTTSSRNSKYQKDDSPINKNINVRNLNKYSKSYINHLINSNEILASMILTMNNIVFYQELMKKIREAINNNAFDVFYNKYIDVI